MSVPNDAIAVGEVASTELAHPIEPAGNFTGMYAQMQAGLPETLARSQLPRTLEKLLGSQIIGKSTLEKLDSAGDGPPSEKINGRVHYRRDAFIKWLMKRDQSE